jgi:FtsH-binding integral membrane protein
MLIAPIVYRGRLRMEVLGITGTMFLLMSAYYYLDEGHGLIENLLVGARLLLPAFPAFLIAYVATLQRLPLSRLALPATGLALAVMAVILSLVHQGHLEQAARVRDTIAQTSSCRDTFANVEALKFFSPAWGSSTVTVIEHS